MWGEEMKIPKELYEELPRLIEGHLRIAHTAVCKVADMTGTQAAWRLDHGLENGEIMTTSWDEVLRLRCQMNAEEWARLVTFVRLQGKKKC